MPILVIILHTLSKIWSREVVKRRFEPKSKFWVTQSPIEELSPLFKVLKINYLSIFKIKNYKLKICIFGPPPHSPDLDSRKRYIVRHSKNNYPASRE